MTGVQTCALPICFPVTICFPGSPTPFIDPADENSKYYNRPDVPPIPHPAELIDDLKKEFPDKDMADLVKLADERIAEEIERRRVQQEEERAKAPAIQIDAGPTPEPIGAGSASAGLLH